MRSDYRAWLQNAEYQENTITAQLHRVAKVEQSYGAIDEIVANGGYEALISELTYSTADERLDKPNPSKLIFDGNIRNNLQSYKNAVVRYVGFLQATRDGPVLETVNDGGGAPMPLEQELGDKQRLSLERDMQAALRQNIGLLEPGLTIVDDGLERGVLSGFIDILCRDTAGNLVVVELKAGKTDARVVGQTLGYMGDLMDEEPGAQLRGIIVAHEFDRRTRSAAKAVPGLSLFSYSISFRFEQEA